MGDDDSKSITDVDAEEEKARLKLERVESSGAAPAMLDDGLIDVVPREADPPPPPPLPGDFNFCFNRNFVFFKVK